MNYYNENDPKTAAWLRELIKARVIAFGEVDERSIIDVEPKDILGFGQCHFFAGIGGWSYALRLAGWPDQRPVWTGSCPCQPFSCAGNGLGETDPRHLWPFFRNLIGECRPAIVFGEQVASADGREWLAGVSADLEALVYRTAAADLCAAGVRAPHIRQRLYWLAHSTSKRRKGRSRMQRANGRAGAEASGPNGGMEFTARNGREQRRAASGERGAERGCGDGGMGHAYESRPQGQQFGRNGPGERFAGAAGLGSWSDFDLIPCSDGNTRRIESGTFPLAHGVPGRVGLLRGYGNAIVPQLAAEFIQASVEALNQ